MNELAQEPQLRAVRVADKCCVEGCEHQPRSYFDITIGPVGDFILYCDLDSHRTVAEAEYRRFQDWRAAESARLTALAAERKEAADRAAKRDAEALRLWDGLEAMLQTQMGLSIHVDAGGPFRINLHGGQLHTGHTLREAMSAALNATPHTPSKEQ